MSHPDEIPVHRAPPEPTKLGDFVLGRPWKPYIVAEDRAVFGIRSDLHNGLPRHSLP